MKLKENEYEEYDSLYLLLNSTIRHYYLRTHELLETIGLYPGQPRVLHALCIEDGLSQKQIGEKLNIKPGNVIRAINGKRVYDRKDIKYTLLSEPKKIVIEYFDNKDKLIIKEYHKKRSERSELGILVVNKYTDFVIDLEKEKGFLEYILNKFKK